LRGREIASIVAAALLLAAPAKAAETAVMVVSDSDPRQFADEGAVGLMVPGAGSEVSRRGALAALVRGEVETSLTGGVPDGDPLIELAEQPAEVTFYVALPPPGTHHNVRRYPIAVVGGGYEGILESSSTRIPGLVSIADVAQSAVALEGGEEPPITSRPVDDAPAELRELDERLEHSHDARFWANLVLVAELLLASLLALGLRVPLLGRAALLMGPAWLSAALALSALDVERLSAIVPTLAAAAPLLALGAAALASTRARLLGLLVAFLAAYGIVLAFWPEVNSLAAIGPHPDGGGRYYGLTNQTATLLLGPALAAGSLAGLPWLLAVALVTIAVVGLSAAGADGGGLLVALTGFGVLALRLAELRLTARRLAALGAGIVVAGVLLVAIDAAAGGSSHVTRSLGGGPSSFADDLAHRAEVTARGATSSALTVIFTAGGLTVLVWLATRRPRYAVLDAMLAALAVSFVVNDTPQDVAAFGALGALSLLAWRRTEQAVDSAPDAPLGLDSRRAGVGLPGRRLRGW
jgi:hypothetical protein